MNSLINATDAGCQWWFLYTTTYIIWWCPNNDTWSLLPPTLYNGEPEPSLPPLELSTPELPLQKFPKKRNSVTEKPKVVVPAHKYTFQYAGHTNAASGVDNEIIETPECDCMEDKIVFKFKTENPFSGRVYVRGRATDPECSATYHMNEHEQKGQWNVPLGGCGMRRERQCQEDFFQIHPPSMNMEITIIVSFHRIFVTRVDRAFRLECSYRSAALMVTEKLDVSQLPSTAIRNGGPEATCNYEIRRGSPEGPTMRYATIGEKSFHVWTCETGSDMEFSMLIHECIVSDQASEQIVMIVDPKGCVMDDILLGEIKYDEERNRAYAQTHVYKYSDLQAIYFMCNIRICSHMHEDCSAFTPPKCPVGRKRINTTLKLTEATKRPLRRRKQPVGGEHNIHLPKSASGGIQDALRPAPSPNDTQSESTMPADYGVTGATKEPFPIPPAFRWASEMRRRLHDTPSDQAIMEARKRRLNRLRLRQRFRRDTVDHWYQPNYDYADNSNMVVNSGDLTVLELGADETDLSETLTAISGSKHRSTEQALNPRYYDSFEHFYEDAMQLWLTHHPDPPPYQSKRSLDSTLELLRQRGLVVPADQDQDVLPTATKRGSSTRHQNGEQQQQEQHCLSPFMYGLTITATILALFLCSAALVILVVKMIFAICPTDNYNRPPKNRPPPAEQPPLYESHSECETSSSGLPPSSKTPYALMSRSVMWPLSYLRWTANWSPWGHYFNREQTRPEHQGGPPPHRSYY